MFPALKYSIEKLLQAALSTLPPDVLPADIKPTVEIERTRDAAHGDFATNIALQLAKPARKNPRQLAQAILDALPASELIEKAEIAGPGFINLRVAASAAGQLAKFIVEQGDEYGSSDALWGTTINLEFVSANPTGPIHYSGTIQNANVGGIYQLDVHMSPVEPCRVWGSSTLVG